MHPITHPLPPPEPARFPAPSFGPGAPGASNFPEPALPEPASNRAAAVPALPELGEGTYGQPIPFRFPLQREERAAEEAGDWGLPLLLGRLTEVSGIGATGILSCALGLVAEAQRDEARYGLAAWVGTTGSSFFPPDAVRAGASPERLALLRLASASEQVRAAATLARSGAFGLIVLDLAESASAPFPSSFLSSSRPLPAGRGASTPRVPPLTRLAGLARRYRSAVVALTEKPPSAPSLDPWVLGRYDAGHGEDGITLTVLKDKRSGEGPLSRSPFPPGFRFSEECDVPAGMSGMC